MCPVLEVPIYPTAVAGTLDLWWQRCNERILKSLDRPFCCIDTVVVWLHKLEMAPFFGEKLLYVFGGLVIHHIHFWLVSFSL